MKANHAAKNVFSRDETRGLALEKQGKNFVVILGTEAIWKNKRIERLALVDKPSQLFFRIVTTQEQAQTEKSTIQGPNTEFLQECQKLFQNITKPLTPANVEQLKELFLSAIKQNISCETLYLLWSDSLKGNTDLNDHQREFFALYCKALQSVDERVCENQLSQLQIFIDQTFSDQSLNQLVRGVVAANKEFVNLPKERLFCLELLSQLFSASFLQNTPSILQAEQAISRLHFLVDQKIHYDISNKNCTQILQLLKDTVKATLNRLYTTNHPSRAARHGLAALDADQQMTIVENSYVNVLTNLLIRPLGGLNEFLIPDIKEYLTEDTSSSPFDKNLYRVLRQLQSNPEVWALIGSVNVNDLCQQGKMAVLLTRNLASTAQPTTADVQKALLSSALNHWRQRELGSCYTTSAILASKDTALQWALQDYCAVLKTGYFTRIVNNKTYTFLASTQLDTHLIDNRLIGTTPEEIYNGCMHLDALQKAFQLIGATKNEIIDAIRTKFDQVQGVSLGEILEELCLEKGINESSIEYLLQLVASNGDIPLLRMQENGVASMAMLPLTETQNNEMFQRNGFKSALAHCFLSLINKSGATNLAQLTNLFARQIPSILQTSDIQDIDFQGVCNYESIDQFKAFGSTVSKVGSQDDEGIRDAIAKSFTTEINFQDSLVKALEKLRFFAEPSSYKKLDLRWRLYIQKGSEFEKITNLSELGAALRSLLAEIAPAEKALHDYLKQLGDEAIGLEFQGYFLPYVSPILTQEQGIQNLPWNFGVRMHQTDLLISTYFQDQNFVKAKITIDLASDPSILPFMEWAEATRREFGSSEEITSIGHMPGHLFRITPNHQSLVRPKNITLKKWLESKSDQMKNLQVKDYPTVIIKMKDWAVKYLKAVNVEESIQEFETALQSADRQPQTLGAYIDPFFLDLLESVSDTTLIAEDFEEIDLLIFQEISLQKPQLIRNVMLHFGDSNYAETIDQTKSTTRDYCFIPNLRSGRWQTVSVTRTGTILEIGRKNTVTAYSVPAPFQSIIQKKELLLKKAQTSKKIRAIKNQFATHWNKLQPFHQALSVPQKNQIKALINEASSFEGLDAKVQLLRKDSSTAKPLQDYLEALSFVLDAKIKYQKELEKICRAQKPPINLLLQELFITHFESSSEMLQALDADAANFLKLL